MSRLLNTKYGKIYLYLYLLTTLLGYSSLIFKFDIKGFPLHTIRAIIFLICYFSWVGKSNLFLTSAMICICIYGIAVYYIGITKYQINEDSYLYDPYVFVLLSRFSLLIYSCKIIKWGKIKKMNPLFIIIIPILFCILIYTLYNNNYDFFNRHLGIKASVKVNLTLEVFTIFIAYMIFLASPIKKNLEFLSGMILISMPGILFSLQSFDFITNPTPLFLIINSILYITGLYLIIKSTIINNSKKIS